MSGAGVPTDRPRWTDRLPPWRGWAADITLGLATHAACRRAARTAYLGNGLTMCRVLDRYRLIVPTHDMSITPALMLEGRWEPWVGRLIARHVRPGMVVADVGANLGYFTMLMADRAGLSGHVHAFEPNAALTGLIERSAAANEFRDRITIHPHALGGVEQEAMVLHIPGHYVGGGYLLSAGEAGPPGGQPVQSRRLDRCPGAEHIQFIKIDVEGHEPEVWAGMTGLLAGPALRTVLLEYTAGDYADPPAFVTALAAPGFRLWLVHRHHGPRPITPEALLALPPNVTRTLLLTR